ncbi:MAG TPA: acyl-CoA dehydrogenase family protein, partial [Ferruginibacter sp.]|nr:acyl-CoA dehydrogenase family protein [Ferruginibacter sp.]HNK29859.1 acyl-CoA dehydrogenase family protein [Ferruginibacter sp.]
MAAKTDNFQSPDYFNLDELLSDEHKLIRETVRNYVKKEISPIIEDYAQRAEFPEQIVKQMGELGVFGPTVPEQYGGGGLDYISYGLMMQELERGDSGVRSTASVQGSLVMFPIYQYGNEEQRNKYLPKLASGEWLGCFGLTEPNHGSDPSSMLSNIKDAGDHVILNGSKMWISNAPFSQVAVVWAKDEAGDIRGLILERGMEGFSTPTTHGKWSLRASATGELVFDNVKVPKANILPNVKGLKGPLGCLTKARYGIAWGAVGAAMDCYDTALQYSKERIQFGRPIGGFQLQQKKLAEMVTEITKAQLLNWRLGVLMNEGKASPQQVSMAKRNACEVATDICRSARQMLGGMGITGEYSVMRHMMNLESVITYEGTH